MLHLARKTPNGYANHHHQRANARCQRSRILTNIALHSPLDESMYSRHTRTYGALIYGSLKNHLVYRLLFSAVLAVPSMRSTYHTLRQTHLQRSQSFSETFLHASPRSIYRSDADWLLRRPRGRSMNICCADLGVSSASLVMSTRSLNAAMSILKFLIAFS